MISLAYIEEISFVTACVIRNMFPSTVLTFVFIDVTVEYTVFDWVKLGESP
jgi:hypothetical protein